jgi:hypothetical protein
MSKGLLTLLLIALVPTLLFALSAEEIITAVDANATFTTSHSIGSITTVDRFGEKQATFEAWSKGSDQALIEFTSPAERGQKVLRSAASLYLYYPQADQIIRLQGAALRQSVLGSDLSYEDMTASTSTLDHYSATLTGTELVNTVLCYTITLTATSKKSAYPIQHLWVDSERFLVLKARYATAQDRPLKEMEVLDTMEVGRRTIARESTVTDLVKRNSATVLRIERIEVDLELSDQLFTLQELSW